MAFQAATRKEAGIFTVCLPGTVSIDKEDLSHITGLYPAGSNDGSYIVEFQDEEIARWYEKQSQQARKAARPYASAMNAVPHVQPDSAALPTAFERPQPSAMPIPFQSKASKKSGTNGCTSIHGNVTSVPAQKKAPAVSVSKQPKPAQTGYEVEVSGLPRHLMSLPMIEAVLDQAKLEKEVLNFALERPDKARISLRSQHAAEACMTHFHGRGWNATGTGVKAKIVGSTKDQSQSTASKAGKFKGKASPTPAAVANPWGPWLPEDAPHSKAHAHAKAPVFMGRTGTSDTSTTVSEEDREQDWWAGELSWVGPGKYGSCF